ncbi:sensor histidine kinase [Mangrovibacterium lignilyticum]|uniref:sensor histidine kinase n=1 Tax=Mangrovibacterium lignilyticum TaxID=2668052 RepID=UPI0013D20B9B|nr:histidine kinase [Mangrovibacterium lignilyticum]
MSDRTRYRKLKNTGHILFWMASLAFAMLSFDIVSEHKLSLTPDLFFKAIILNIGFALAVYSNLYLFIPRLLKKHKYIFYVFWLVLTLFGSALLVSGILSWVEKRDLTRLLLSANFFTSAGYVFITSLAKFLTDWIELQDISLRYHKAERQRLEAELNTLKAQINPHFLFNSLNNIYSLALVNSEKTPQLILKLSDLMRHVLYESRENFISLKKEIGFVTNFIELQRIRLSDQVKIAFTIEGEPAERKIMPLVFEPFLDNAFKHGPRSSGDDAYIRILIRILENELDFEITNSFNAADIRKPKGAHGVGLENVKQRLAMLYTKNEYKLDINGRENDFEVKLKIKLK